MPPLWQSLSFCHSRFSLLQIQISPNHFISHQTHQRKPLRLYYHWTENSFFPKRTGPFLCSIQTISPQYPNQKNLRLVFSMVLHTLLGTDLKWNHIHTPYFKGGLSDDGLLAKMSITHHSFFYVQFPYSSFLNDLNGWAILK